MGLFKKSALRNELSYVFLISRTMSGEMRTNNTTELFHRNNNYKLQPFTRNFYEYVRKLGQIRNEQNTSLIQHLHGGKKAPRKKEDQKREDHINYLLQNYAKPSRMKWLSAMGNHQSFPV